MNIISPATDQTRSLDSKESLTFSDCVQSAVKWGKQHPAEVFLILSSLATAVYFYAGINLFSNRSHSAARWAWESWNAEGNMEHARIVPLIALALAWYHRDRIRAAPKKASRVGLAIIVLGLVLFLLAVRTLQPRLTLLALPFLTLGYIWFFWGKYVARILLFPCVFLLFTINSAFVEQATFKLQFIITSAVGALSNLVGIKIAALGTTLSAVDGTFNFEIAEGCSGIRSLIAMTMLAALYVHLTQKELWKKLVIFTAALPFAIVGNIGRIFTVVLFAKFIDKDIAAGIYHDYSGFLFFPFAIAAMIGFSKLLNYNFEQVAKNKTKLMGREDATYDY